MLTARAAMMGELVRRRFAQTCSKELSRAQFRNVAASATGARASRFRTARSTHRGNRPDKGLMSHRDLLDTTPQRGAGPALVNRKHDAPPPDGLALHAPAALS